MAIRVPVGLLTEKIASASVLILFAPAQDSSDTVKFQGSPAVAVTVLRDASTPGGTARGGTHSRRTKINAAFADLHVENLPWNVFKDPAVAQRWDPTATPTPSP